MCNYLNSIDQAMQITALLKTTCFSNNALNIAHSKTHTCLTGKYDFLNLGFLAGKYLCLTSEVCPFC